MVTLGSILYDLLKVSHIKMGFHNIFLSLSLTVSLITNYYFWKKLQNFDVKNLVEIVNQQEKDIEYLENEIKKWQKESEKNKMDEDDWEKVNKA